MSYYMLHWYQKPSISDTDNFILEIWIVENKKSPGTKVLNRLFFVFSGGLMWIRYCVLEPSETLCAQLWVPLAVGNIPVWKIPAGHAMLDGG